MVLDIELFRADKGGNPELVRESQRRRHKDVGIVDEVIEADTRWRMLAGKVDTVRRLLNLVAKTVGAKKKAREEDGTSDPAPASFTDDPNAVSADDFTALSVNQLRALSGVYKTMVEALETERDEVAKLRDSKLLHIGNIVHEEVPPYNDEDLNQVIRTWGDQEKRAPFNHIDLLTAIDGMDTKKGSSVAGNRGYFLKGNAVSLQLALINYAMQFLSTRGFQPMYTPFFMRMEAMAQVAQLEQFDEELYKVSGEGEDKYLIATSEQSLCAYFAKEWIDPKDLPIKLAGYSSCFRKEVGSHGRDTLGIFRVHQFEKIEQFVVTSPKDGASWAMMHDMIGNAEEFYKALAIPYRVVSIVGGALNNAAAMKYDLEALFPASAAFRELVSCSNCTDYQARHVECRFGYSNRGEVGSQKEYVHMLNSTLCAVTRVLCCICENYQTPEGIVVPEVLRPYMPNHLDFIPFVRPPTKVTE